jgi:hypothetical protein
LFFATRRIWADMQRVIQPIRSQNSSYTANDYIIIFIINIQSSCILTILFVSFIINIERLRDLSVRTSWRKMLLKLYSKLFWRFLFPCLVLEIFYLVCNYVTSMTQLHI